MKLNYSPRITTSLQTDRHKISISTIHNSRERLGRGLWRNQSVSRIVCCLAALGSNNDKRDLMISEITKIIKHFAEQLSGPLTDIINTSFQEKCFGEIWKAYNCCPIPKSNPCTTVGNIRPIALTSVFSKIQESFALDWMLEDSRDCLSERQFGGIPRSSSVLALLEMLHSWFVALEKSKSVIRIVFLDFSKAFDLIDHNILLNDFKLICWSSSRFTTMVSLVPIRPVTEGKHRWIDIVF